MKSVPPSTALPTAACRAAAHRPTRRRRRPEDHWRRDNRRTRTAASRTRARWALLALLVVAGAALGVGGTAIPAAAHAGMVATAPSDGAVLDRVPDAVSVRFSEPVQAGADGLRVLDADGARVDAGDAATPPGHPDTVTATLRPGLGDGTYTVAWRTTSADSHPVHGAFAFTVGEAGAAATPLAGADRGSDPVLSTSVVLARGAGYAGFALLVGATGILLLLNDGADRARLAKQARAGGLTVVVSAGVGLLAQGPYAAGAGPGSLLEPALLGATLAGRTGLAESLRIVIALGLTVAASALPASDPMPPASSRRNRTVALTALVPLAALAATFSATGHAAAGRRIPVAFTADVLHLLAMGIWLGGLVALGTLCTGRADPGRLAATVQRFSPLAAWCVAVLIATGTLQAWRQLGNPDELLTTGYGRLLTAKVAVILLLLGAAYRARRWTRRHARPDAVPKPTATALRTLRRTLAAEAAVGTVVLALSTLLAGSAPPGDRVPPPTVAAPVHLHARYDTGGVDGTGTATALLTPRTDGTVGVDLHLTGPTGRAAQPAQLTAAWSLPARDLGPLPMSLRPGEAGHWQASARLSPSGDWRLALTVRSSDVDETTVTFPAPSGGTVTR